MDFSVIQNLQYQKASLKFSVGYNDNFFPVPLSIKNHFKGPGYFCHSLHILISVNKEVLSELVQCLLNLNMRQYQTIELNLLRGNYRLFHIFLAI